MKYFELELESRGTTFFGGEEHPKMLDYMIWPWLERADIVPLINSSLELLPKSNFPLLVTIYTSTSLVLEHLFRVYIQNMLNYLMSTSYMLTFFMNLRSDD